MTSRDQTGFRRFLFDDSDPRLRELDGLDADGYREAATRGEFTGGLIEGWKRLYPSEFRGVTNDGVLREGLYSLGQVPADEGAPTTRMVAAARHALHALDPGQRLAFRYDVDAVEWQSWANPEFMQHDTGLRLERLEPLQREAMLGLVAASTSERGYDWIRSLMQINGFLGEVVRLPALMNEFSYNMALYGVPSETEPWGWQLFGHHVAMNCLVIGPQLVFTPVFFAAEPDGLERDGRMTEPAFRGKVSDARAIMAALSPEQRDTAIVYHSMVDAAMPEGRLHPGDERHLAGAFQDNRVIPYEGVRVSSLSETALAAVERLVDDYLDYLPAGPRRTRAREIHAHLDDTWFSWIGGHGHDDVFYLRLQSPVLVLELDHHCGVFLTNREPAPFHIHTVMRTPNGNDYGRALVREHRAAHPETPS